MQSQIILKEIENATELCRQEQTEGKDGVRSSKDDLRSDAVDALKLEYFATHLESLRLTLAVLLQTLYTAQSIMWSK